jgi:hypothetical protein
MAAFSTDSVSGSWVHSHEEDSGSQMVFRPASFAFPPSRGRMSFELRADGSYAERSPGPVDAPEDSSGHWSLDGERLVLEADGDKPGHAWQVEAAEKDRLTVKK